jgi:hypothetical protein
MLRLQSRLASGLFLAVFVLGSFGLANIDAWAFHGSPGRSGIDRPHFEAAGGTCGHADRCILGVTLPGPRAATPFNLVERLGLVSRVRSLLPPAVKRVGIRPHALPQPRAPPLSLI